MREIIKNNVRIYDPLMKILNFKKNSLFRKHLKKVSAIDSICDFYQFAEAVEPFVRREIPVDYSVYGYESYYYGYRHELMHYAGVKVSGIPVFPRMEHGIRFGGGIWSLDTNALAYACQGMNRADEIWKQDPTKMVFGLGPYIHYAREYYDDEKFQALKKKFGKTLLVFPSHTAEGMEDRPDEENFVKIVYEKYAPHFDTVMVCSYWRDAKTPVIEEFKRRGAVLVSAGYRGDLSFIRRLKTLIRLCDAAVGDSIGTNIGFCLYMDRPYYLERINQEPSPDAYYEEIQCRMFSAFGSATLSFTEEQLHAQKELYTAFWGGNDAVYSREEAKQLIHMVIQLQKAANYRADRLPQAIEKKLRSLPKTHPEYKILTNAVKNAK